MPKKTNKKAAKSKKEGKKGGKKSDKKVKNLSKLEDIRRISKVNATLWETKLAIADKINRQLQERIKQLTDEKHSAGSLLEKTEKDSIEVFSFLKKEKDKNDAEISSLRKDFSQMLQKQKSEKEQIVSEMERSIRNFEENLEQRGKDVHILQQNLKDLQKFSEEREEFYSQLNHLKLKLGESETERNNLLEKMEMKFFEEKMRIRQEAVQNIRMLAEEAHRAALSNLGASVKSVYRQNMDMRVLLKHFKTQMIDLTTVSTNFIEVNQKLNLEVDLLHSALQKSHIDYSDAQKEIQNQSHRIRELEDAIARNDREILQVKQNATELLASRETEAQKSADRLSRILQLERKRTARVYALANRILEQRSDIEKFFLTSLAEVRDEIATTQTNYKKDAKAAYEARLRLAYYGAADYPRIRTFQAGLPSTETVYNDLKAANRMPTQSKVSFSDLTWEQKERVLANLFARMNASPKLSQATGTAERKRTLSNGSNLAICSAVQNTSSRIPSSSSGTLVSAESDASVQKKRESTVGSRRGSLSNEQKGTPTGIAVPIDLPDLVERGQMQTTRSNRNDDMQSSDDATETRTLRSNDAGSLT